LDFILREFSELVISWQQQFGRHDLPWQVDKSPYKVWISEIMLQQTQVETVKKYFTCFIERFPTIEALSNANEEDVMALWSGLGYYSRARNLLKAATQIAREYRAKMPDQFDHLISLPGIGRSTAGAILSLAYGRAYPILDGNVQRVLSRVFGVKEVVNSALGLRKLWGLAEKNLPESHADIYTQGLMDLGATICVRKIPRCDICPLVKLCYAGKHGEQHNLPVRKKRNPPTKKTLYVAVFKCSEKLLFEKTAYGGVWRGLWHFVHLDAIENNTVKNFSNDLGLTIKRLGDTSVFKYRLTHIEYEVYVRVVEVDRADFKSHSALYQWFERADVGRIGTPRLVGKIINMKL
jgi:A/G-specific adenine glycosylase